MGASCSSSDQPPSSSQPATGEEADDVKLMPRGDWSRSDNTSDDSLLPTRSSLDGSRIIDAGTARRMRTLTALSMLLIIAGVVALIVTVSLSSSLGTIERGSECERKARREMQTVQACIGSEPPAEHHAGTLGDSSLDALQDTLLWPSYAATALAFVSGGVGLFAAHQTDVSSVVALATCQALATAAFVPTCALADYLGDDMTSECGEVLDAESAPACLNVTNSIASKHFAFCFPHPPKPFSADELLCLRRDPRARADYGNCECRCLDTVHASCAARRSTLYIGVIFAVAAVCAPTAAIISCTLCCSAGRRNDLRAIAADRRERSGRLHTRDVDRAPSGSRQAVTQHSSSTTPGGAHAEETFYLEHDGRVDGGGPLRGR